MNLVGSGMAQVKIILIKYFRTKLPHASPFVRAHNYTLKLPTC